MDGSEGSTSAAPGSMGGAAAGHTGCGGGSGGGGGLADEADDEAAGAAGETGGAHVAEPVSALRLTALRYSRKRRNSGRKVPTPPSRNSSLNEWDSLPAPPSALTLPARWLQRKMGCTKLVESESSASGSEKATSPEASSGLAATKTRRMLERKRVPVAVQLERRGGRGG